MVMMMGGATMRYINFLLSFVIDDSLDDSFQLKIYSKDPDGKSRTSDENCSGFRLYNGTVTNTQSMQQYDKVLFETQSSRQLTTDN